MKIYTKTGDEGETSLFAGGRVRKHHARVEGYGTIDELNSSLGFVRALGDRGGAHPLPAQADAWLETIQNDLFVLGADLATPNEMQPDWLVRLTDAPATALERAIDQMDAELQPLKAFILPGGIPPAAALHVARTICRRAERACVMLHDDTPINTNVLIYLNRLSDFLFTLARWVNDQAGESETKWSVRS